MPEAALPGLLQPRAGRRCRSRPAGGLRHRQRGGRTGERTLSRRQAGGGIAPGARPGGGDDPEPAGRCVHTIPVRGGGELRGYQDAVRRPGAARQAEIRPGGGEVVHGREGRAHHRRGHPATRRGGRRHFHRPGLPDAPEPGVRLPGRGARPGAAIHAVGRDRESEGVCGARRPRSVGGDVADAGTWTRRRT